MPHGGAKEPLYCIIYVRNSLKMVNNDFALQRHLWPQSKNKKKTYLVRALGNTLVDQSSWLVLLGLCGRSSKMCQNRTFRPSVGYDNDDVIGPNFFCELIGPMPSFFKIKFGPTREKPHPAVSCYLNSSYSNNRKKSKPRSSTRSRLGQTPPPSLRHGPFLVSLEIIV